MFRFSIGTKVIGDYPDAELYDMLGDIGADVFWDDGTNPDGGFLIMRLPSGKLAYAVEV